VPLGAFHHPLLCISALILDRAGSKFAALDLQVQASGSMNFRYPPALTSTGVLLPRSRSPLMTISPSILGGDQPRTIKSNFPLSAIFSPKTASGAYLIVYLAAPVSQVVGQTDLAANHENFHFSSPWLRRPLGWLYSIFIHLDLVSGVPGAAVSLSLARDW